MEPIYKRVILKLSGEALADNKDSTILDHEKLLTIANTVKMIRSLGVDVGIVVGAGNIWRGRLADKIGIEPSTADYMGMLGTVINALAIQSAIEEKGLPCRVMSAINIPQVCEPYYRRKAIAHLDDGIVVIFGGGTGNPYCTTDSCAALRALEVGADAILMAKNGVDGVYDADPRKNPNAKKIDTMSYDDILKNELKVMDTSACALCKQNHIPIIVFDFKAQGSLVKIMDGEAVGTYVS